MTTTESVSVAVERAIHDVLRDAVQRISDQHGIQVQDLRVDWLNISSMDKTRFAVREITATTSSLELVTVSGKHEHIWQDIVSYGKVVGEGCSCGIQRGKG